MSAFPDEPDHFLQWLRTRSEFERPPRSNCASASSRARSTAITCARSCSTICRARAIRSRRRHRNSWSVKRSTSSRWTPGVWSAGGRIDARQPTASYWPPATNRPRRCPAPNPLRTSGLGRQSVAALGGSVAATRRQRRHPRNGPDGGRRHHHPARPGMAGQHPRGLAPRLVSARALPRHRVSRIFRRPASISRRWGSTNCCRSSKSTAQSCTSATPIPRSSSTSCAPTPSASGASFSREERLAFAKAARRPLECVPPPHRTGHPCPDHQFTAHRAAAGSCRLHREARGVRDRIRGPLRGRRTL